MFRVDLNAMNSVFKFINFYEKSSMYRKTTTIFICKYIICSKLTINMSCLIIYFLSVAESLQKVIDKCSEVLYIVLRQREVVSHEYCNRIGLGAHLIFFMRHDAGDCLDSMYILLFAIRDRKSIRELFTSGLSFSNLIQFRIQQKSSALSQTSLVEEYKEV